MNEVEEYYDHNTSRFLKYDPHYDTYGIHREVWGEGVVTHTDAFNFVNLLILRVIKKHKLESILDLGCGVGSSLFYLAQAYAQAHYYGITISSAQVQLSKDISKKMGLQGECIIAKGDFQKLPQDLPSIDLAFSIEAFVHATDSNAFFSQIAAKMKEEGLLIICDDFLSNRAASPSLDSKDKKLIQLFRKGWVLSSLMSIKELQNIAAENGYRIIEDIDLTPNLRLMKRRDILISLIAPFFKYIMHFSPYVKAYVGGDALQKCLLKGLVEYRFLVFQK